MVPYFIKIVALTLVKGQVRDAVTIFQKIIANANRERFYSLRNI